MKASKPKPQPRTRQKTWVMTAIKVFVNGEYDEITMFDSSKAKLEAEAEKFNYKNVEIYEQI